MSAQHVAKYLNDHLAGSVTILELLQHLETTHPGTPIATCAHRLRSEIEEEQVELKALIQKVGAGASVVRRATAWLAEKVAELKLKIDDPGDNALRLLEAWEAISLGIEGKRSLWFALDSASTANPALLGLDYGRLIRQAEEQRTTAERLRREAALSALAGGMP